MQLTETNIYKDAINLLFYMYNHVQTFRMYSILLLVTEQILKIKLSWSRHFFQRAERVKEKEQADNFGTEKVCIIMTNNEHKGH